MFLDTSNIFVASICRFLVYDETDMYFSYRFLKGWDNFYLNGLFFLGYAAMKHPSFLVSSRMT